MKIQVKVQNVHPFLYFPKTSSWPDWSLCCPILGPKPGLYGYVVPKPWPQHTTNNPATDTTMGNLRCSLIFQGVAAVLVLTGVDITLHAPTRLYLHCYM